MVPLTDSRTEGATEPVDNSGQRLAVEGGKPAPTATPRRDDPRVEAVGLLIRAPWGVAPAVLAAADAVDPLRAFLANPDDEGVKRLVSVSIRAYRDAMHAAKWDTGGEVAAEAIGMRAVLAALADEYGVTR